MDVPLRAARMRLSTVLPLSERAKACGGRGVSWPRGPCNSRPASGTLRQSIVRSREMLRESWRSGTEESDIVD